MSHHRYARDPYWIESVRYTGECSRCKTPILKGTRAFYYPNGKRLLCSSDHCGGTASREFDSAVFDEAQYNGGY